MVILINVFADAPRVIEAVDPAYAYFKIIDQLLIVKLYRIGIIVKIIIGLRL